jgi:hypothetical protein
MAEAIAVLGMVSAPRSPVFMVPFYVNQSL